MFVIFIDTLLALLKIKGVLSIVYIRTKLSAILLLFAGRTYVLSVPSNT